MNTYGKLGSYNTRASDGSVASRGSVSRCNEGLAGIFDSEEKEKGLRPFSATEVQASLDKGNNLVETGCRRSSLLYIIINGNESERRGTYENIGMLTNIKYRALYCNFPSSVEKKTNKAINFNNSKFSLLLECIFNNFFDIQYSET
ncbi:hypothetical protein [Paenibacillus mucilaginosus]|uniref:hypothetical protein n=1 Tax=Paenibacillus mucilaginosus TaxID=61624 RepID=UPI0011802486|nr:hypothetical protein [Paenibacillus mucilaginosus]MCG7217886.1 hypothetical protein [Paenibacillus mucilaginosus]WDM29089.1 hypothetical protein KCX80_07960 [Paenibacillus mucilaginosus]